MRKSFLYIFIGIIIAAQVFCAVELVIAFDVVPMVKSEINNLFHANKNIDPNTDLVVVYDVFGRAGYMDNQGNVVMWPKFQDASQYSDGLASVQLDNKWGYINKNGNLVIKPQFEWSSDFNDGLALVSVNEKYGAIDTTGNIIISPQFESLCYLSKGYLEYGTEDRMEITSQSGIMDKQGNILYLPEFSDISQESDCMIGFSVYDVFQDVSYGYLDSSYHKVIAAQYSGAQDFSDGFAEVQDKQTKLWGMIDNQGKTVMPFQYADIRSFSEGMAAVLDPTTLCWGFINNRGSLVIPCKYDDNYNRTSLLKFQDGLACVAIGENQYILIDKEGKVIVDSFEMYDMIPLDSDFYNYYGPPGAAPQATPDYEHFKYGYSGEGLHWIEKTPGTLTFFDNKGIVKFTVKGEMAQSYSDGLCQVRIGTKYDEKYNDNAQYSFIDVTGKRVIDFRFGFIGDFKNGIAETYYGRSNGYINKDGNTLWLPGKTKTNALWTALICFIVQLFLTYLIICAQRPRSKSIFKNERLGYPKKQVRLVYTLSTKQRIWIKLSMVGDRMTYKFRSTLNRPEGTGTWTYMNIPFDTFEAFGAKGHIEVKGKVDSELFMSTLMPDGEGGHFLVVNKAIRDKIGKAAGDTVDVELEPNEEPRELVVPDDFQSALALNKTASDNFEKMSYSHKKRYVDHICEAKAVETRMNRIDKAIEVLAEGNNAK